VDRQDTYAPLRHANFRKLLVSHATLTLAREAQIVVVGWQVFEKTGDPLALGLIGLSEALPAIAVALYAGHVVDRANRRWVAAWAIVGMLLSAVALLGLTLHGLRAIWPVYAVIFLSGIARSFVRPAISAMYAEVLPRELYAKAVAWRTSTWQLAAIAGPACGGLVYGWGGPVVAYASVAVVMAGSIAMLGAMTYTMRAVSQEEEMPIGESLRIGIRFLLTEPIMLAAMTLDLFAVLFGGATALLPAFAKMLGAGPQGLGILRAAPAIGSIFSGMWLAHRPAIRKAGHTIFLNVAIFGLTMIGFALSRSFWLSFAMLLAGGVADAVSVVIRSTLLQTRTPVHLLGRVSSVNQIFIGSSNEIGAFESGVAARLLGVVPSVIFGGVMTLVVVAITAWRAPALRKLEEL
jgi:predicted MFS family arabinose efflux permease